MKPNAAWQTYLPRRDSVSDVVQVLAESGGLRASGVSSILVSEGEEETERTEAAACAAGRVIATRVGFGICCWKDDKGE
jgi:hypothetical protein